MAKKKVLTKEQELEKTEVITAKLNEVKELIAELDHDDHGKKKKELQGLALKKIDTAHYYLMSSVEEKN